MRTLLSTITTEDAYIDQFPFSAGMGNSARTTRIISGNTEALRDQLWDEPQLELLGFSDLHQAYLGMFGRRFVDVLSAVSRSAIDQTDANGRTTLSWATMRGDDQVVAQLLRFGADPNRPDGKGYTSLHYSLYPYTTVCLQQLLGAKADVEAKWEDSTALHLAIRLRDDSQFSELLVAYGADLESQDGVGRRPLHIAAEFDRSTQVSYLLRIGADFNAQDQFGTSALSDAVCANSHDALRTLLKLPEFDINVMNPE